MKSNTDEIKQLLQPVMQAVKVPLDFSEQSLFETREVLKKVFDCIDQKKQKAVAQGFWSIQALVGALIRKGSIDQSVAITAIGGLLESLMMTLESTPEASFSLAPPSGDQQAASAIPQLRLASGPGVQLTRSAPSSGATGSAGAPLSKGGEHSLGQLLVLSGKISQSQLGRALDLQKINGRRLGEVLIAMEAIGIQTLEEALSRQQILGKSKPSFPNSAGSIPRHLRES